MYILRYLHWNEHTENQDHMITIYCGFWTMSQSEIQIVKYLKSKSILTVKKILLLLQYAHWCAYTFWGVKFTLFWIKFTPFPVKFLLFYFKLHFFPVHITIFTLSNPLNPDGLVNGVLPCRFTGRLGSIYWLCDWLIDWIVFYAVSANFKPHKSGSFLG